MHIVKAHVAQSSRSFTWFFAPDTEAPDGMDRLMDFLYPDGPLAPDAEKADIQATCYIDRPLDRIKMEFTLSGV